MDYLWLILFIIILLAIVLIVLLLRGSVIYEYQRGLLYSLGKFVKVLGPGAYYYIPVFQSITKVDVRLHMMNIPSQEVLTSDNISIKISLATSYRVADPYLAYNEVAGYNEAMYQILQLTARDVIGNLLIDELLAQRGQIGQQLLERSQAQAVKFGIDLQAVNLKDVMFPGELKNIFAQVVNARKEGQAALERARGETAALRNLANAAQLFKDHPQLWQLRLLQGLEKGQGNTIVLLPQGGLADIQGEK